MKCRIVLALAACLAGAVGLGCRTGKELPLPVGDADARADAPSDVPADSGAHQDASGGNGARLGDAGVGGSSSGSDAGPDALLREIGVACSGKADCASANCVDGVCCDSACTGSCSACNLTGFLGRCSPVAAGDAAPAPHPACIRMAATTCQQNGFCDGKGACQLYASGEVCAGGACSATTQAAVTGSSCDGLGTCKPAVAVACAPFKCKADGTACAITCTTDLDCQGQPCVAGSCGKVANGSKCTAAAQCTSGNCVDGYCCDLACGTSCQACDLAGSIGKCTSLAANQPPRNGRAACASGVCGSQCDGTSGSCVFAPATTSCGAAKCATGMVTAAVSCDGRGSCPVAAVTSCGGFICTGTACKTSCASDADCLAPTPYCSGVRCQASKPAGRTCGSGGECATGNCVDGICCATSSCPTCQACNLGTPGTCALRTSGAADSRCLTANCQSGTCSQTGACNQAGDGTSCGTNRFCHTGTCGACVPDQACAPANPCKNGTTLCATGLSVCNETTNKGANTSCGAGAVCSGMTATSAHLCNASGVCISSQATCPSGCNATQDGCLTCTGGTVPCAGRCCGGTTPVCVANACVECSNDGFCSGMRPSCDPTTHACVCRRPSAGNLVTNGGFNTSLAGWISDPTLGQLWKSDDADTCQGSGSMYGTIGVAMYSNCMPVTPGGIYYFGFRFKHGPTVVGAPLLCYLVPYADANCTMTPPMTEFGPGLATIHSTVWASASTTWAPVPSDVRGAMVGCQPEDTNLDQIFFSPSPGF